MVIAYRGLILAAVLSVVIAAAWARPVPAARRRTEYRAAQLEVDVFVPGEALRDEDGTARSERSTNLSHITGTARKIQMYVKNKHLQILPDGTVNGTVNDGSDYTILQRTSVNNGQLKIQGVATCLFLCMDSCGLLYGSREFTEDCIFNEMIEQHHYNTYSSARYSDRQRTLYLALNQRGQPRKVQVRGSKTLGKLSTYVRVLTQTVPQERVDHLVARVLHMREASGARVSSGPNPIRHHGYHLLCQPHIGHELADDTGRDKYRCRARKKRKKKKRRCRDDEEESEECEKEAGETVRKKRKCDEEDAECRRKSGNERNRRKCLPGELDCKEPDAKEQAKGRNQKKCENGACKNKNGGKNKMMKCDKGDKDECQRRLDAARDRRKCEGEDNEEECRKRLKEARKRRLKSRDKKAKDSEGDVSAKKRRPNSPVKGKNNRSRVEVEVATNLNTPSDSVTQATATSTARAAASVDAPTERGTTTPDADADADAAAKPTDQREASPSRTIPRPEHQPTPPSTEWP